VELHPDPALLLRDRDGGGGPLAAEQALDAISRGEADDPVAARRGPRDEVGDRRSRDPDRPEVGRDGEVVASHDVG
jgi:hypothetical protein